MTLPATCSVTIAIHRIFPVPELSPTWNKLLSTHVMVPGYGQGIPQERTEVQHRSHSYNISICMFMGGKSVKHVQLRPLQARYPRE